CLLEIKPSLSENLRGATAAPGRAFDRGWRRSPLLAWRGIAGEREPKLCLLAPEDSPARRDHEMFGPILIPGHLIGGVVHHHPDVGKFGSDIQRVPNGVDDELLDQHPGRAQVPWAHDFPPAVFGGLRLATGSGILCSTLYVNTFPGFTADG